ncbi:MAG: helix-turn-helix transcriptional regulator [Alphaproteobacteria bacterium]|nr:helix-turn-helix transcriptional regulator [Alphaproteobacteria bacterium]
MREPHGHGGHRHHRRGRHGHHHDMPWGGRRFFGAGEMRLALLALLAEAPQHGYELMRRLEDRLEGAYTASPGAIYPTLQQLEDEGLIAIDGSAGRKVCTLTDAGRGGVAEEADTIAALWARAAERRAVDFSDTAAMPSLAGPLRALLTAIKDSVGRAPDAAALAEVQAAIDAARNRIEAIGR